MTMSSISKRATVERSLGLLIKFMMQSKHRIFEIGSELNLTNMQAMVIFHLDEPSPMNKLAELFNCDASNMTGIVDGLEQKGFAKRYSSEQDRRIKMVSLSEQGEALRSELLHELVDKQGTILFRLSDEELDTFNSLLQKITL